jgi:hypothetical protein
MHPEGMDPGGVERSMRWAVALLAMWLTGACGGGTLLHVHVRRDQSQRPVPDASVLLYNLYQNPCQRRGASGGGVTDEHGHTRVTARYCGARKLWVSAQGFESVEVELDSCGERRIDVALSPVPPPPAVSAHGPGQIAIAFVGSVIARDQPALRALLADASTWELYEGGDLSRLGRPDAFRATEQERGDQAVVELELPYDNGCAAVLQCELRREAAGWRVVSLSPL